MAKKSEKVEGAMNPKEFIKALDSFRSNGACFNNCIQKEF